MDQPETPADVVDSRDRVVQTKREIGEVLRGSGRGRPRYSVVPLTNDQRSGLAAPGRRRAERRGAAGPPSGSDPSPAGPPRAARARSRLGRPRTAPHSAGTGRAKDTSDVSLER